MNIYKVKTRFIFEGIFEIYANTKEEAKENVFKHCGLVIGGDLHSSLPDEEITWDFPVHPKKKIISVKLYLKNEE